VYINANGKKCNDIKFFACVLQVSTVYKHIKVKQSRYRPVVAQRVPGSYGSQIS